MADKQLQPEQFERIDESDDNLFYEEPRLVKHIDEPSCEALALFFHVALPKGGAILAAVMMLIRLVRGRETPWGLRRDGALCLACCGVTLYSGIGLLSLFFAGNYLDYGALPLPFETAKVRAMGSLGIEVGVAMGVSGVLTLIFDALTAWEEED